jgi:hypothetical protein
MVFSNLQAPEKEAFFSLLDEYFQSRPEIFANLSHGSPTVSPAAVSAASKMVSAGLRHAAPNNASRPNAGGGTTLSESEISSVADRVAAFSLQKNSHPAPSTNTVSPASAFKVRLFCFSKHAEQCPVVIENRRYRHFFCQELLWIIAKHEQLEFSFTSTSYPATE